MGRTRAAIGTVLFFCAAPGLVAGIGPWLLSDWDTQDPVSYYWPFRVIGAVLVLASAAFLVNAFVRFVVEGLGTPAPVAPTEHLVVGGIYRYVRNPMYVAVDVAIFGQALFFGQADVLWYGVIIALVQAAFVHFYEEPGLRKRYGAEFDAYRHAVPAWWPRLRPWQGTEVPRT